MIECLASRRHCAWLPPWRTVDEATQKITQEGLGTITYGIFCLRLRLTEYPCAVDHFL